MLGDPLGLIFATDHEAADILEEEQGDAPLLRQFDEMRALDRAFAEQHAIVREDRYRDAPDMSAAADKSRAICRLELVELAAVADPGDDFVHVLGRAHVDRKSTRLNSST